MLIVPRRCRTADDGHASPPSHQMQELSNTLQDIPLAGMVPLILLMLVGLMLWAAGSRVFRAGFAAAGFLLGGGIGWLIGGGFNLGVPVWIVAITGAVLVACLAALTYRLAIAGALAIVLGVASPLAVLTVNEWQGPPAADEESATAPADTSQSDETEPDENASDHAADEDASGQAMDEIDRWLRERFGEEIRKRLPSDIAEQLRGQELNEELADQLEQHLDDPDDDQWTILNGEFDEQIQAVRTMAARIAQALRDAWQEAPESLRPVLVGAAVVGALLGVLIGALVPTFSTTVVTAFLGSLLWLTSLRVVAEKLGVAAVVWMPASSTAWLSMWIIIALVGLAIQWTFLSRKADKKSA